jgi:hypothetical protein
MGFSDSYVYGNQETTGKEKFPAENIIYPPAFYNGCLI